MAHSDHTIEIRIIVEVRVPQPEAQEEPLVRPDVPLGDIVALVAHRFELPVERLLADARAVVYVQPRHLAMLLARERTPATLPEIGRAFNRHHTSVLHGCRRAQGRIATDTRTNTIWRELCAEFDRRFNGAEPNPRG